jgi:Tol biopolymer transport system component
MILMNCRNRFAALLIVSLAHAGETKAALHPVWYLKQVVYDVGEQWVNTDDSGRENDMRESRIEIRSGDGLRKKRKVEGGAFPEWSASGQKIAFLGFCNGYVRCNQIVVMNADGSNRKVITRPSGGQMTRGETSWVSNFSWSPREDRIAYVERTLSGSTKVLIINSDGSGAREVAKVENTDCHFPASSPREQISLIVLPTWSPDGLAFAFNTCSEGEAAIVVADKDGNNSRVLIKGGHSAVWSTDGKHLLYLHGPTANDPSVSVCIVGLDGKDLKRIFNDRVKPFGLTWLPDANTIAFVSMRGNKAEVFQINADGTGLRMIGSARNEGFSLGPPIFSPDGKKLVAAGYRCCPSVRDRNWTDPDRSAVILVDLTSNQQRIIARGLHPSVLWAVK